MSDYSFGCPFVAHFLPLDFVQHLLQGVSHAELDVEEALGAHIAELEQQGGSVEPGVPGDGVESAAYVPQCLFGTALG